MLHAMDATGCPFDRIGTDNTLGHEPQMLQRWQATLRRPEYLKLGKKIQYPLAVIEDYENQARTNIAFSGDDEILLYLQQTGQADLDQIRAACLGGKKSALVSLQILLVRALLKVGLIPIPIRQLKSADLDDLMDDERLQVIETEAIFKGASSYFMVVKKIC